MTNDPYSIAVSEVMLQQTQVARVIEKYKFFLKKFPTVERLAKAPLQEVLSVWSGLGYNRRAKFLQHMAKHIVQEYHQVFPTELAELMKLPGIGRYTAGAIMAFAYNKPGICIETNIRTVFIHHFFDRDRAVSDSDIVPLIESTLDMRNPRIWYWALMDYGSYLKTQGIGTHRQSATYKKQGAFKGSTREVRGAVLKRLAKSGSTLVQLKKELLFDQERIVTALEALQKEQLIIKKGLYYRIA